MLQRSIDGTARGWMRSGPSRVTSALAAVRSMPGPGSGESSVGQRKPALPRAAPDPSAARSTSVTEAPRSCNASALVRPMRPPPTMTTDFGDTRRRYPASRRAAGWVGSGRGQRWQVRRSRPAVVVSNSVERAASAPSQMAR